MIIPTSILASLWLIKLGYRIPMLVGSVLVTVMLLLLGTGWTSVQIGPMSVSGFWLLASIMYGRGYECDADKTRRDAGRSESATARPQAA